MKTKNRNWSLARVKQFKTYSIQILTYHFPSFFDQIINQFISHFHRHHQIIFLPLVSKFSPLLVWFGLNTHLQRQLSEISNSLPPIFWMVIFYKFCLSCSFNKLIIMCFFNFYQINGYQKYDLFVFDWIELNKTNSYFNNIYW